jgi:hypothetical protein
MNRSAGWIAVWLAVVGSAFAQVELGSAVGTVKEDVLQL